MNCQILGPAVLVPLGPANGALDGCSWTEPFQEVALELPDNEDIFPAGAIGFFECYWFLCHFSDVGLGVRKSQMPALKLELGVPSEDAGGPSQLDPGAPVVGSISLEFAPQDRSQAGREFAETFQVPSDLVAEALYYEGERVRASAQLKLLSEKERLLRRCNAPEPELEEVEGRRLLTETYAGDVSNRLFAVQGRIGGNMMFNPPEEEMRVRDAVFPITGT